MSIFLKQKLEYLKSLNVLSPTEFEKRRDRNEDRVAMRREREYGMALKILGGVGGMPVWLNISTGDGVFQFTKIHEAAKDAREQTTFAHDYGGAPKYGGSIQLNPDGTWEYVDLTVG
jgi:hypothetical protein